MQNQMKMEETYYVSVIATSHHMRHSVAYDPIPVTLPRLRKNNFLFYVGMVALLVPFLVLMGLYYYCKRRGLQTRLEYEAMEYRSFNNRGKANKDTSYAALSNNNE